MNTEQKNKAGVYPVRSLLPR